MADSMLTPFLDHLEGIPVLENKGRLLRRDLSVRVIYSGLEPEAPLGRWRILDISNIYIHLP